MRCTPSLAARFTAMVDRIRASLAEVIEHRPASLPADELAATLICLVPGYLLQLAILGPAAVDAVPAAVRALFPD